MSADLPGRSRWVSAAEAGQLCHVSERTVRRWIASGRLPADLSGPTLRLAVADLQPYLAAAVDTLPDQDQPPRAPSGHLTVLRPDPDPDLPRPRFDSQTDGAADHPVADPSHPDNTPDTSAQLVATLEASIVDLRQRLDHAEKGQAELRRLLALVLQERALPDPNAEDTQTYTPAGPRPWWERWLWWRG